MEEADTGDILLFRSSTYNAMAQRTFTGSYYDHVAFILKFESDQIVLLEATGEKGVALCTWC